MLYSFKGQTPQPLPFRITLSDGNTRTDPSTFTEEEIIDAGYILAPDKPDGEIVYWANNIWISRDKTPEELERDTNIQWGNIRQQRDILISDVDWRYIRYAREIRLNLPTTDDIAMLDTYTQALADITTQTDPYNIIWPMLNMPSSESTEI